MLTKWQLSVGLKVKLKTFDQKWKEIKQLPQTFRKVVEVMEDFVKSPENYTSCRVEITSSSKEARFVEPYTDFFAHFPVPIWLSSDYT